MIAHTKFPECPSALTLSLPRTVELSARSMLTVSLIMDTYIMVYTLV